MIEDYKYFTSSEEDLSWGLALNVVGEATIQPNSSYPPVGHPLGYNFNWEAGRTLNEFQINYITEGYGTFENKHGKYKVAPGTIVLLYPNEWHRYRPLKKTGWIEHYIGFSGPLATSILELGFLKQKNAIIKIEFNKEIQDLFYAIKENSLNEKSGYQHINTGLILTYIGKIISVLKNKDFEGKEIEKRIQQACLILRENITQNIDARELANRLHLGYSNFRIMFKKYTGMSPIQYHLQLRIKHAEDMLIMSQKPVKEIAYDLGFQSVFYFSRLFKQKTGKNPSDLRKT